MERIRDEAHRFAISRHRAKRSKKLVSNPLDEIDGIGKKRRQELLRYFGSSKGVAGAGINDLCKVDGISKKTAEIIYNHFNK